MSGCDSGSESFALMVLGDSMVPEFNEGEIIVVEPDGATRDGPSVLAFVGEEWTLRPLRREGEGWRLQPLNPAYPATPLPDLAALRGVVIQKALPGRRRASKRYV